MCQKRICGIWGAVSCESMPHLVSVKNPPQGAPEAPARRTESLRAIVQPGMVFCTAKARPQYRNPGAESAHEGQGCETGAPCCARQAQGDQEGQGPESGQTGRQSAQESREAEG